MERPPLPTKQQTNQQPERQPDVAPPIATIMWEDVPVDIYRHFGVELGTTSQKELLKLRDIYKWIEARTEEKTIGNVLTKISVLENELGVPHIGERRYDKIWQWLKLQNHVDELTKRQKALQGRFRL